MNVSLTQTMQSIDWNRVCVDATANVVQYENLEKNLVILKQWLNELTSLHKGNAALPFLYEAHVSANDFCAAVSLGLYKLSATSIRTILESFLNFSYYKDHARELDTLVNNDSFYLGKKEIIEYHKVHTPKFNQRANELNTTEKLNSLYKYISRVIHGQIPGKWHTNIEIKMKMHEPQTFSLALDHFQELVSVINLFQISSLLDQEWASLNIRSKKIFLKGFTPEKIIKIERN